MYLRITQRQNRDGSTVAYYALAESVWNADAKRREARVVHSFGRADQVDRAALERLVKSINRVLDDGAGADGGARESRRSRSSGCSNSALARRPHGVGGARRRRGNPRMRGAGQLDRPVRDRAVRHGRQPSRRSGLQAGVRGALAA